MSIRGNMNGVIAEPPNAYIAEWLPGVLNNLRAMGWPVDAKIIPCGWLMEIEGIIDGVEYKRRVKLSAFDCMVDLALFVDADMRNWEALRNG